MSVCSILTAVGRGSVLRKIRKKSELSIVACTKVVWYSGIHKGHLSKVRCLAFDFYTHRP